MRKSPAGLWRGKESDLVPELWQEEFRIRSYDADLNGRASLTALYSYFLESAGDHATAGGFGFDGMQARGLIWVLTRFKLVVDRYPGWGGKVEVETWAKGREGLFYTRDYLLKDAAGEVLARATSSWAVLAADTHRPETRDIFIGQFPQRPDREAVGEKMQKLPPVETADLVSEYRVRWSDLDFNRHVNSMRYVEWILNGLDEATRFGRTFRSMEVNYLAETLLGEDIEIRVRKTPGSPDALLASITAKATGKDAARALFLLG
jgi:medium-chain acyl-[acyl-carrier-protein] hydrolase